MMCKRMLRTALYQLAGLGTTTVCLFAAPATSRADLVTPSSELSQANRLSIFHDYSLNAVGLSSVSVPGSAGGGVLTTVLGSWASTDPSGAGRAYQLSITPIAGYDSDPEAHHFAKGGGFAGADLNANYQYDIGPNDPTIGSPTQFRVRYDATGAIYDGAVFNSDTFQQTLAGSYRRSIFNDSLVLGFMIDDQFTTEYGNAFLNSFDAGPSVEWFLLPTASVEANYEYSRLDFFQRAVLPKNPDANRHTINTTFHFYPTPQMRGEIPDSPDMLGDILRQSLYRATIGYAAVINDSTGQDYHYEANRIYFGFEGLHASRLPDVTLDVTYAHEWQNYFGQNREGPLVIAGSPTHIRRKDHLDVFTLRANARLFDLSRNRGTLGSFVQWDLIADRSNIVPRDFNEFIISGGITYQY